MDRNRKFVLHLLRTERISITSKILEVVIKTLDNIGPFVREEQEKYVATKSIF